MKSGLDSGRRESQLGIGKNMVYKQLQTICAAAANLYQARAADGGSPLYQRLSFMSFMSLVMLPISACEASQKDVEGADAGRQSAADRHVVANKPGESVTQQQVPINQQFRSLDEYLAHLERMEGPVDGPWYKEIRPGIYELQTGNLRVLGAEQQKQIFTREELEKKFGFAE
jgi:hypothetical protein